MIVISSGEIRKPAGGGDAVGPGRKIDSRSSAAGAGVERNKRQIWNRAALCTLPRGDHRLLAPNTRGSFYALGVNSIRRAGMHPEVQSRNSNSVPSCPTTW